MKKWTFGNDNGRNPQMRFARIYVEHWEEMKANSHGYLLWGNVGTGEKEYGKSERDIEIVKVKKENIILSQINDEN